MMENNLSATVFVYRHKETGAIHALYAEDAQALNGHADYDHIATLEPRHWIECHYDDKLNVNQNDARAEETNWLDKTKVLEAENDKLRSAIREAKWCVEYMANGMTHAEWATKKAQEALVTILKLEAK